MVHHPTATPRDVFGQGRIHARIPQIFIIRTDALISKCAGWCWYMASGYSESSQKNTARKRTKTVSVGQWMFP